MRLSTTLGRLRFTGILEGLSFIILLAIAMPLKYFAGRPEMVRVIGMAHGIFFLIYVLLVAHAKIQYKWSWKKMLWLWVASVIPLGTFYVDYKVLRFQEDT